MGGSEQRVASGNDGIDLVAPDFGGATAEAAVSGQEVSRNGDRGGLSHRNMMASSQKNRPQLSKKKGCGSALRHWSQIGRCKLVVVAVAHAREYHRFVVPVLRVESVGGHLVERHTLDGAGSVEGAVVSGPSVARVPIDESRRRGDYEDERRQMNERDANHLGACHGDLRRESHVDTSLFT